jgi:hypothetical protein
MKWILSLSLFLFSYLSFGQESVVRNLVASEIAPQFQNSYLCVFSTLPVNLIFDPGLEVVLPLVH